jgi:hypothetical protein
MINFHALMDLLPSYFKAFDTYKDQNDKGVLERFLELIGESVVDDTDRNSSMLPNIDNILDIIDVETTRAGLLDYIYDFLGAPPQEYTTPVTEGEFLHNPPFYVWYLEYNVQLEYSTKLGYKPENAQRVVKYYSAIDRRLIRYAVSLYKIRGTEKFYRVLLTAYFKLKGYTLEEENLLTTIVGKARYDTSLTYDSNYQYDGDSTDCKACSSYIIDLTSVASTLKPEEQARLERVLAKYAPINVQLMVAYAFCNILISTQGPSIEEGMVVVTGNTDKAVRGYDHTVSIYYESNIIFLGWYDNQGTLLSTSFSYTFKVTESTQIIAKYERDDL